MPERIQLSRRAGWRKPEGTVVVARPSRWGNTYRVARNYSGWAVIDSTGCTVEEFATERDATDEAVRLYRAALIGGRLRVCIAGVRRELANRDLGCWCPLEEGGRRWPCHADVLLELANRGSHG